MCQYSGSLTKNAPKSQIMKPDMTSKTGKVYIEKKINQNLAMSFFFFFFTTIKATITYLAKNTNMQSTINSIKYLVNYWHIILTRAGFISESQCLFSLYPRQLETLSTGLPGCYDNCIQNESQCVILTSPAFHIVPSIIQRISHKNTKHRR